MWCINIVQEVPQKASSLFGRADRFSANWHSCRVGIDDKHRFTLHLVNRWQAMPHLHLAFALDEPMTTSIRVSAHVRTPSALIPSLKRPCVKSYLVGGKDTWLKWKLSSAESIPIMRLVGGLVLRLDNFYWVISCRSSSCWWGLRYTDTIPWWV